MATLGMGKQGRVSLSAFRDRSILLSSQLGLRQTLGSVGSGGGDEVTPGIQSSIYLHSRVSSESSHQHPHPSPRSRARAARSHWPQCRRHLRC